MNLWIDVAVMASLFAVGNILFGHFEERTPKWRRVLKFFLFTGADCADLARPRAVAGRSALVSALLVGRADHSWVVAAQTRHQRVHRRAEREVLRAARLEDLMYRRILVAVENSGADRTILAHVVGARAADRRRLLLVHVADGWAARNFDQLKLRESEEMKADRAYLDRLRAELAAAGFTVDTRLAMGDPATELIKAAEEQRRRSRSRCPRTATASSRMSLLGATAGPCAPPREVPVLLLRAQ